MHMTGRIDIPARTHAKKKGQAALEFITTYGWAFIIILTAIAALAYFGVLKPPIADRCTIGPEFVCLDYRLRLTGGVGPANAELIIANGKDFNMNISRVSCILPNGSMNPYPDPGPVGDPTYFDVVKMDLTTRSFIDWEPGEKRMVSCKLSDSNNRGGFVAGDKAKLRFALTYANQDVEGFNHTIDGEVIAEVVS